MCVELSPSLVWIQQVGQVEVQLIELGSSDQLKSVLSNFKTYLPRRRLQRVVVVVVVVVVCILCILA